MALLITETIAQVALESQVAIDITTFLHKSLRNRLRRMKDIKPATDNVIHIGHDNSMQGEFCNRFSFNRMRRASQIGLIYWRSFKDDMTTRVSNFAFPDLLRGNPHNFMLLYVFGHKNELVTAGMGMESHCLSAFMAGSQFSAMPATGEPAQMRNLFSEYQATELSHEKPDFSEMEFVAPIEAEITAPPEVEKKVTKKKATSKKRKAKATKSDLPAMAAKFDCADTTYESASNFAASLVSEIASLINIEESMTNDAPTVLKLDATREKVAVGAKRGRKSRSKESSEIVLSAEQF